MGEDNGNDDSNPKVPRAKQPIFASPQFPARPSLLLRPLQARPTATVLSKLESMQVSFRPQQNDTNMEEGKVAESVCTPPAQSEPEQPSDRVELPEVEIVGVEPSVTPMDAEGCAAASMERADPVPA